MLGRSIAWFSFILAALLFSPSARAADDTFDIISIDNPSPNVEIVHIRQPDVKRSLTSYPQIAFAPGDSVIVNASGCVQTGGVGDTWKRYVNPSGEDSDRYYFGEIWIPGATGVMIPIAGIVGKPLHVTSGTGSAGLFLRLGYSDDNYDDNGYQDHDNGTENQCAGADGGAAEVTLTITHNAATPAPTGDVAPFDLFWDRVDGNAIPLDARWGEQINHDRNPRFHPTGLAGDDTCATPWLLPCTTQTPSVDLSSFPNSTFSCDHLGGPLSGHANWGPGTYTGSLTWDSKSDAGLDDDYSIDLATTNNAGATEGRPAGYHIEFDSDETIDNFTSKWWTDLKHAVDNEGTFPTPSGILDGQFAVVTGLVDLDCAHPCSGELHPAYGLSVRAIGDSNYELWAMFVRNWGNEGGCSSQDHELMLANNQYTVMLPWPQGATSVVFGDQTAFASNSSAVSISVASIVPGVGVELTFNMPTPDKHALIDGVLELKYTGVARGPVRTLGTLKHSPGFPHVLTPAVFARVVKTEDDRLPPMNAAQLKIFHANMPAVVRRPDTRLLQIPTPHVVKGEDWRIGHRTRPRLVPLIRSVSDSVKLQRDLARMRAVSAAFGGAVPGFGPLPTGDGISGRASGSAPPTPRSHI